jgi:lantibiotic modifying enzyme
MAQGNAGLALLWAQMDACFPGEGWDLVGREHLERAARNLEQSSDAPLGIFSGITGVAFAAWQLSRDGTRYRRLLRSLDDAIVPRALAVAAKLSQSNGCAVSDFDAISGVAGVGAYLLCRSDDPKCRDCLEAILQALIRLLSRPDELPAWHTPPEFIGDERARESYPEGWLNCGLAHGIPGPLALLALAAMSGFSPHGLLEAINSTAGWLCRNRCDDQWGSNWPTAVRLERNQATRQRIAGDPTSSPGGPSRSAWCYGSPGVARALWLAGRALDCEEYRSVALESIDAVFRRPRHKRFIDSPSFCHGVAGLLQITLRFADEAGDDRLHDHCGELVRQLLAAYSPDYLLGFRHLEIPGNELDQPGLLDGAPGIVLVLLASATHAPPAWDKLFLLS